MLTWFILWYLSGICSFIYWWTKTEDLTFGYALASLYIGLAGPLAFLIGMLLHGKEIILIKKRKK